MGKEYDEEYNEGYDEGYGAAMEEYESDKLKQLKDLKQTASIGEWEFILKPKIQAILDE